MPEIDFFQYHVDRSLRDLRRYLRLTTAFIGTDSGLHTVLSRSTEVQQLRKALDEGRLSADDINSFISNLLFRFARGQQFDDDTTLAAIAVALESLDLPHSFADEYLEDLAQLRITELPMAPRVARLCLENRENTERMT